MPTAPSTAQSTALITSLLDTDLYKFSMWQALWHRHPSTWARYRFVCRQPPPLPLAELLPALNTQLDALCSLRFNAAELEFLAGLGWIQPDFLAFLQQFQFQRRHIRAWADGPVLHIEAEGPQPQVMAFEVFVLAIVNELHGQRLPQAAAWAEGRRRLHAKVERLRQTAPEGFEFFDFGLRRRFSGPWQQEVVSQLWQALPGCFRGSSSVLLAYRLGLPAIGTMAHEYLQTYQALPGVALRQFQRQALHDWLDEYHGVLAVALTDVVGRDAFFADFDAPLAQAYAGLRHDSGDPVAWADQALAHYDRLGVDARCKRLVFSDGLTLDSALALHQRYAGRVGLGFGIGTHLSNDIGQPALASVMKLVQVNHRPVAKLCDSPGKTLCDDPAFIRQLAQTFGLSPATAASCTLP